MVQYSYLIIILLEVTHALAHIGTILETSFAPIKFLAPLPGIGALANVDTKLALLYFRYFICLCSYNFFLTSRISSFQVTRY